MQRRSPYLLYLRNFGIITLSVPCLSPMNYFDFSKTLNNYFVEFILKHDVSFVDSFIAYLGVCVSMIGWLGEVVY